MNDKDFERFDEKDFRSAIEFFADKRNEYSKEELYDAFAVVTRLYLDELISARLLENLIVEEYGELAAERFFEAVADSSRTVKAGDKATAFENDPRFIIRTQFDLIEKLNGEN